MRQSQSIQQYQPTSSGMDGKNKLKETYLKFEKNRYNNDGLREERTEAGARE